MKHTLHEVTEQLLREQSEATIAFRDARNAFAAVYDKLHFPLGSPVQGYDLDDITAILADWIVLRDDDEDAAIDAAQDMVEF
jgi:hypothetical protein